MLRKNKNLLEKKKYILFRLDLAFVSFLLSFNSFVVSLSVSFWESNALSRLLLISLKSPIIFLIILLILSILLFILLNKFFCLFTSSEKCSICFSIIFIFFV